jgi:hypothetical protein
MLVLFSRFENLHCCYYFVVSVAMVDLGSVAGSVAAERLRIIK